MTDRTFDIAAATVGVLTITMAANLWCAMGVIVLVGAMIRIYRRHEKGSGEPPEETQ